MSEDPYTGVRDVQGLTLAQRDALALIQLERRTREGRRGWSLTKVDGKYTLDIGAPGQPGYHRGSGTSLPQAMIAAFCAAIDAHDVFWTE